MIGGSVTRLQAALGAHKLLQDKRDRLLGQVREIRCRSGELRRKVEAGLSEARAAMAMARALMGSDFLEQALLCPGGQAGIKQSLQTIAGVSVPVYDLESAPENAYPYGFAQTSAELDAAQEVLARICADMTALAQSEKRAQLLEAEMEVTCRRTHHLEQVVIPALRREMRRIALGCEDAVRWARIWQG